MARTDIRITSENELYISNGDFAINVSDLQHEQDIIQTNKGEWKEFPLCGVGIDNYLNSENPEQFLEKEISLQFQADGITGVNVIVRFGDNGILEIGT